MMTPLRDDDRILRDIENIPEQRRREGLMAIPRSLTPARETCLLDSV